MEYIEQDLLLKDFFEKIEKFNYNEKNYVKNKIDEHYNLSIYNENDNENATLIISCKSEKLNIMINSSKTINLRTDEIFDIKENEILQLYSKNTKKYIIVCISDDHNIDKFNKLSKEFSNIRGLHFFQRIYFDKVYNEFLSSFLLRYMIPDFDFNSKACYEFINKNN